MIRYLYSLLMLILFISCAFAPLSAQEINRKPAKSSPVASSRDETIEVKRNLAVLRAHEFAERAWGFQNVEAKTYTLINIGDKLWKSGDEKYARQLFLKTYDWLRSVEPESPDSIIKPLAGESKITAGKLASLRTQLLAYLTRHDAVLAKQLMAASKSSSTLSEQGMINLHVATSLLQSADDPVKAAQFAQQSLSSGVTDNLVHFLLLLRDRDTASADDLYIKTLNHLITQPNVDGYIMMMLGAYVFTSPYLDLNSEQKDAIEIQSIDNTLVVNLSANRPNASQQSIRAYLSTAMLILERPVTDSKQRNSYYITARQLLPKAQQFSPNLVPRLTAVTQALLTFVPPSLLKDAAYDQLTPADPESFDEMMRALEKISEEGRHDEVSLMMFQDVYERRDLARARAIAEKVKKLETRSTLLNLIKFSEALEALDSGRITLAEEMANKLDYGIERAALWLAIARVQAKNEDFASASVAISTLIKEANRLEGNVRPFLLLGAGGELARFDSIGAVQALNEAVRAFNSSDGGQAQWFRVIEAGGRKIEFRLAGVEAPSWSYTMRRLVEANQQEVIATAVTSIKPERQQAFSLVALTDALLR